MRIVHDSGGVLIIRHRVNVAGNRSGIVAFFDIQHIQECISAGYCGSEAGKRPVGLGTFGKDLCQRQAVSFVMAADPEEQPVFVYRGLLAGVFQHLAVIVEVTASGTHMGVNDSCHVVKYVDIAEFVIIEFAVDYRHDGLLSESRWYMW